MASLLIKNARIVDGSGAAAQPGDVLLDGDRVAAVGADTGGIADRVIDADGRVVCPGFIDMHSHVDFTIERYPRADGMLRQGVTTIVTGNCGMSPFPARAEDGAGADPRWPDLDAFAAAISRRPVAVNVAPLVGHGAVRLAAMADPGAATPKPSELTRMRSLVAAAIAQGAHGMSTGLIYDPGRFAETAEIVELAMVVAAHGGFYASHIRDEGDALVDAVREALEIGHAAQVPVQLSHHKAKRRRNWGAVGKTLPMVDDAAAAGLDVLLDCYPFPASSTSLWAYLPTWARASRLLGERNDDGRLPSDLRNNVIEGMEERFPGSSSIPGAGTDLDDLTIGDIAVPDRFERHIGQRLVDAAHADGVSPADLALDMLLAGEKVQIIDHAMSEADMRTVLAHPRCMIGSDARLIHPDIPGVPHPRNYATFTRFLRLAGDGLMPLEEAVHRCTGLPAQRLGWARAGRPAPAKHLDRGLIRPGAAADLLMFDPDRLRDHSTFDDPKRFSTGLDLVVVNGVVVVENDDDTGAAAGRFVRNHPAPANRPPRTETRGGQPWPDSSAGASSP
ncbi:N-acyl-D-amino-acid deacylase family protein [Phytoactinopolyspora limicola]|uniref:N-acyl-D-amino-acid deacylase family protein n=1 Tax=Phytoactinopolyspora limicola TaxID=2715536 RepID=UPI00140BF711|nr:amidohydrolase family protein [Phytoactinopolyspora limicola]